jgi:hypothetical protein
MDDRRTTTYCLLWTVIAATVLTAGCVRRRMTIRSNPPGAVVYVDNHEVGTTPCPVDFIYYGTREVKLVKDGYETLVVNQPIPTPWYEVPPLDFVSENVIPGRIRDERLLTYNLRPQVILPTESLLSRAESLRRGAQVEGPIQPVAATLPSNAVGSEPRPPSGFPETLPPPPESIGSPGPAAPPRPPSPRAETLPPQGIAPIYAPPPLPHR